MNAQLCFYYATREKPPILIAKEMSETEDNARHTHIHTHTIMVILLELVNAVLKKNLLRKVTCIGLCMYKQEK